MKSGTQNHGKFKLLKMTLNLPDWQVVGILESIWSFAAQSAWEGDIGKHSDEIIAASIEWQGDPSELISALVSSGWVDEVDDARRLIVHDWVDHCPSFIKKRIDRKVGANGSQREPVADNGSQREPPDEKNSQRRINPSQPSPSQPNQSNGGSPVGGGGSGKSVSKKTPDPWRASFVRVCDAAQKISKCEHDPDRRKLIREQLTAKELAVMDHIGWKLFHETPANKNADLKFSFKDAYEACTIAEGA